MEEHFVCLVKFYHIPRLMVNNHAKKKVFFILMILGYLYREMPTMNLEKIYSSPYRSSNFQQLLFYDIFCATRTFTSYWSSKYISIQQY